MECLSSLSSKPNESSENKIVEFTSELFKKITCVVKNTLVDFAKSPFDPNHISSIFFSSPKDFFVVQNSTKISLWTRGLETDREATLKAFEKLQSGYYRGPQDERFIYKDTYHDGMIIRHRPGDQSLTLFDFFELTLFPKFRTPLETHFSFYVAPEEVDSSHEEDPSIEVDSSDEEDPSIEQNPHRIYLSGTDGFFHKWNLLPLDQGYYQEGFKINLAPLYIDSMTFCGGRIIAACNSIDETNPFSCIQWFSEEGKLSQTAFKSKNRISSFTLVKNNQNIEKQIFIVYEHNVLFMHNFDDKKTLSTKLSFFKEERLTISLIRPYLVAYQQHTSDTNVFVFNQENLQPLFQFDLKDALGRDPWIANLDQVIISLNQGQDQNFIVTSRSQVLECLMVFDEEKSSDSQEDMKDRPSKRLKTEIK